MTSRFNKRGRMAASRRTCLVLLLAALLSGCGSPRPPSGAPERLDCDLKRFVVGDVFSGSQKFTERGTSKSQKPRHNVLALSAGGELGVFGAGFLRGWQESGRAAKPIHRDDIQVVTGVSAGALLATHAFIGDDSFLHEVLPRISYEQLFTSRSFSLLWSNAVLDDSGKNRSQANAVLTERVIDAVANSEPGRFLYIGAVDLDSGKFLQIDMVRLARETTPVARRNACYRAVVGASTAVPVLMSPKFVDDMMLSDGAIRHHLFIPKAPPRVTASLARTRVFVVVNQDTTTADPSNCDARAGQTCNGIVPIAMRVAGLAADQGLHDSLRAIESLARRPDPGTGAPILETFYVTASNAVKACLTTRRDQCSDKDQGYCLEYMLCLAEAGRAEGRTTGTGTPPWRNFDELGFGQP